MRVTGTGERLVNGAKHSRCFVLQVDEPVGGKIFHRPSVRLLHHLVNLIGCEPVRRRHLHSRLSAAFELSRGHVEYSVGVYQECHLYSWHASGHWRNTTKREPPEASTVLCQFSFALQNVNIHRGLTINVCCERLGGHAWHGAVAHDELAHSSAEGLYAHRQRGNVQQQRIGSHSRENTRLHCGAHRDDLIGIHRRVNALAEELAHHPANQPHACAPADHYHFVDVAC